MSGANVQLDAIRDFRIALVKFIEMANICLADADGEILRTLHWLEMEQVPYWATQIRKREENVGRWKDAVRQKTLYKDVVGGRQSAVDELKQLKKAEALLLEAQEKFTASKQYIRRIQKQQMEYKGQVTRLNLALTGYLAACVAKLQALQNIIAEYARIDSPTEQRSMAQAPDQQRSTPEPSPAEPKEGDADGSV
jgi:hypothetical protein